LLDRGEIKECRPGDTLFKERDPPKFVLLVLAGKIQVFVERDGGDLVLTAIPRAASVRAIDKATVLQWSASAFRNLLLRHPLLSERIFKESLRTLVEKERSLIDSVMLKSRGDGKPIE
jgi:CRP-like cAMP-binding protein